MATDDRTFLEHNYPFMADAARFLLAYAVEGPDGKPVAMPFLAGLVGDDFVEVRSGLTDGDQVVLPQATVTQAPDQGGPPPGN